MEQLGNYLASKNDDGSDEEEALIEAQTHIAAIGMVPAIKDFLEQQSENLGNAWLPKSNSVRLTIDECRLSGSRTAAPDRAMNGCNGPFMSVDTKGGNRTFAAACIEVCSAGQSRPFQMLTIYI
jgi:hypothetical protein